MRILDPATVFWRAGLLLCGVALTWTCAAFGLFVSGLSRHGCGPGTKLAARRVREVDAAILRYEIDRRQCPATMDDLTAGDFLNRWDGIDPWKRTIAFSCTGDEVRVVSAGPDGVFGTPDDITNES